MYSSANLGLHRRRIKKEICKVFAHNKLKITIEANKKIVNFLDALRYSRNRSVVRCHCCEFLLDIYIYIYYKWLRLLLEMATTVPIGNGRLYETEISVCDMLGVDRFSRNLYH